MHQQELAAVTAALAYIEGHLDEKLGLDTVARAARYSKFHLHRLFRDTVGLTPHDYIQRRQLTQAAEMLVSSGRPLIQIALEAGYQSQQAFAGAFKAMYKQTPLAYRQGGAFYPLQLAFRLEQAAATSGGLELAYAGTDDIPGWQRFLPQVIEGFPCLDEAAHLARLREYIRKRQLLIMRDGPVIIGAAAFSPQAGSIDFLAEHPQYRSLGAGRALLEFLRGGPLAGRLISISTFRQGDKADTGQRAAYLRLGFREAEPGFDFGYPTQRLIIPAQQEERP